MADYVAIYDQQLELGAVIDTDTMRAMGPVGAGQNAREELSQFIDKMPEAVWRLPALDLVEAWMQFWGDNFAPGGAAQSDGQTAAPLTGPAATDDAAALATREASAAGAQPPAPAPADTDTGASAAPPPPIDSAEGNGTSTADTVSTVPADEPVPCFACGGTGVVPGATEGSTATCNLCQGTGKIPAGATA